MSGAHTYPVYGMDAVLRKGRAAEEWFEYLVAMGLLVKKGYVYELDLPCSFTSIRSMDLDDRELRKLLIAFLRGGSSKTRTS